MGAVFNAFLEGKLFVELELEEPSVSDILSRTAQVIKVSQIELIEERFLLELRQRKEENISIMHEGRTHSRRLLRKISVMSIGPPIVCQD